MISPFSVVKNTRESYSIFIEKLILKSRFNLRMKNQLGYHSKPYWQYKSTCQINSIVTGGDTMKTIEDHIQKDKDLLTDPTISSAAEGIIRKSYTNSKFMPSIIMTRSKQEIIMTLMY